ncbi:ABC transporter family member [Salix suchowensis]|nr:ABC transporter family member [Salix suchowensis]
MDGVERARASGRRPSHSNLSRSISRSLSRASWNMEDMFSVGRQSRRSSLVDEDEEALKWAAIEKLPTYNRLRTSIIKSFAETEVQGNKTLLHKKLMVGIRLPTIEVRFDHLTIEADCTLAPELSLPSQTLQETWLNQLLNEAQNPQRCIWDYKPSRMALLLGPPSSGKTTLLLALAGKLDPSLKVTGT